MKIFFRRGILIIFAILIQVIWIFLLVNKLSTHSTLISWILSLLSILVVIYIINKDENPQYKLSWIFFILLLPFFGSIMYLLVSGDFSIKILKNKMNKQEDFSKKYLKNNNEIMNSLNSEIDNFNIGPMNYLVNEGYPVYKNTESKFYSWGEYAYKDMLDELKKAKHFIFLEYFIIEKGKMWNEIAKILKKKAKQGVDVRIIYDDVGSLFVIKKEEVLELEKYGIKIISFNPLIPIISIVMNHRDHRKIMVIDGNIAFTGGINLADEYINEKNRFGKWKDTAVLIKGDAVRTLTILFLNMWNSIAPKNKKHKYILDDNYSKYMPYYYKKENFKSDGYVIPYAHSPLSKEILAENLYLNIINNSKKYLYISTPYLIIDYTMQTALSLAAKRGVDVRILTPGIPDKKIVNQVTKANYPKLIKNGVKIYEYTPGFIHSKCFICDDEIATVGTINMDYRSLYLHFENGCYFYKTNLIKDIKKDFDDTFKVSVKYKYKKSKISILKSAYYAVLNLIAPLM